MTVVEAGEKGCGVKIRGQEGGTGEGFGVGEVVVARVRRIRTSKLLTESVGLWRIQCHR